MRIWKQIICVEMFFVASVKKSPYLHTIVVASLERKTRFAESGQTWHTARRVATAPGCRPCSKNDTNLNTDPFYFSFYLPFDLGQQKIESFSREISVVPIMLKLCTCQADFIINIIFYLLRMV